MSCSLRPEKSPWDVEKYANDETFNEVINVMIYNTVFGISLTTIAIFVWSPIPWQLFNRAIRACFHGEDLKSLTYFLQRDKDGSRQGSSKGINGMISKVYRNLSVFWKWMKLDREMLLQSCNLTAYQFLVFQRYLLTFFAVLTVFILSVVLPYNIYFGSIYKPKTFGSTTMGNINISNNKFFWLHLVVSGSLLPIVLIGARMFFKSIFLCPEDKRTIFRAKQTLMLSKLPKDMRSIEAMEHYISSHFPWARFTHSRINTETTDVASLIDELSLVKDIIKELHALDVAKENIFSWRFFPSFFYSQPASKVTALEYYSKWQEDVEDKIKLKVKQGKECKSPMDSGFVRMQTVQAAKEVVFFYNNGLFKQDFEINFAPEINDIQWEALLQGKWHTLTNALVDFVWLLVIIFLVNAPKVFSYVNLGIKSIFGPENVISTNRVLKTFSYYMVADFWSRFMDFLYAKRFWTISSAIRRLTLRTFLFQFLAILLLPLTESDSVFAIIKSLTDENPRPLSIDCILFAETGAYYISVVFAFATYTFALDLMRIPALFYQIVSWMTSHSWAEIWTRQRLALTEPFPCVGAMSLSLIFLVLGCSMAAVSPLVVPAVFAFFVCRHIVDSYRFLSGTSKAGKVNPRSYFLFAVNIAVIGALLSLICTSALFLLSLYAERGGIEEMSNYAVGKAMIAVFIIHTLVVIQQIQSDQTWPFRVIPDEEEEIETFDTDPFYEPPLYTQ